jgi:hypothetical protein
MENTEVVYTTSLYKEIEEEKKKLDAEIYKLNVIIQDYKDRLDYVERLKQNLKLFDRTPVIENTWVKVGYKFYIEDGCYTVKEFKYRPELVSSFIPFIKSEDFIDNLEGEICENCYKDYYIMNKISSIICDYYHFGIKEKEFTIWFSLVNEGFTKENLILE